MAEPGEWVEFHRNSARARTGIYHPQLSDFCLSVSQLQADGVGVRFHPGGGVSMSFGPKGKKGSPPRIPIRLLKSEMACGIGTANERFEPAQADDDWCGPCCDAPVRAEDLFCPEVTVNSSRQDTTVSSEKAEAGGRRTPKVKFDLQGTSVSDSSSKNLKLQKLKLNCN